MFHQVVANSDIDSVVSLAKEVWTEHYTPIIGAEQVEYMLGHFHSKAIVAKQIATENYQYYLVKNSLVKNQQENVGYFGIQFRDGEVFLSKLYVLSSQRGLGLGRKSLDFIVALAKENSAKKISLTVNKYNTGSIAAYYKVGFVKTGEICVDIGQNYVMDDLQMELVL